MYFNYYEQDIKSLMIVIAKITIHIIIRNGEASFSSYISSRKPSEANTSSFCFCNSFFFLIILLIICTISDKSWFLNGKSADNSL